MHCVRSAFLVPPCMKRLISARPYAFRAHMLSQNTITWHTQTEQKAENTSSSCKVFGTVRFRRHTKDSGLPCIQSGVKQREKKCGCFCMGAPCGAGTHYDNLLDGCMQSLFSVTERQLISLEDCSNVWLCCAVLYKDVVLCCFALCCVILCCAVLCCAAQARCAVLCNATGRAVVPCGHELRDG